MLIHGAPNESYSTCNCPACQNFLRPKSTRKRCSYPDICTCLECQNTQTVISSRNEVTAISERNTPTVLKKAGPVKQKKMYDLIVHEVIQTIDSETGKRYTDYQSRKLVYLP